MALGRISGPLLKSNLLRNGVDLGFETNLLYLDVTNRRVGINTSTPSNDLQVNGTARATTLNVSGTATFGTISFTTNNITTTSNTLNLTAAGSNPVVYQGILQVGNLQLTSNTISNTQPNGNIVFTTTGSGAVQVNSNLTINGDFTTQGNLTVGGNITVTGNIQIGDQTTDTVAINAGVTSNILPAAQVATLTGVSISGANPGVLTFASSSGAAVAIGMFLSGGGVTSGTYIASGSGTTWTLNQAATGTPTTAVSSYNLGSSSLQWANIYANQLTLNNFNVNTFTTANLTFSNGTITNTVNNQDLNLVTSGSGGINIGNFKIGGNSITNTVANQISSITQNTSTTTFTASIASQNALTFSGSVNGSTLTVSTSPNNGLGGSLTFNGSNYLLGNSPFSVGTQAYTAECFVYLPSFASIEAIIGATVAGGNSGFSLAINSLSTIQIDRSGFSANQYNLATPMTLNTWHHILATRNASGQETVFVDGVKTTSAYGTNVNYTGNTGYIGSFGGAAWNFIGSISQLKMTVGTNYIDPTATSITVPTAPLSVTTNTKILLLVASAGSYIADTSSTQVLTNTGSVSYSSTGPFSAGGGSGIAIGHVLSGGSLPAGTYIVSNISGTGTSSSSQWIISSYLTQSSTTITATPTLMTVTGNPSGTIINGMSLSGTSVLAGTRITAFISGSGGAGTYYVTPAQTVSATITGTIQGYVNIGGTNGVVIPAGTTLQRPGTPIAGMLRFNSDPATLAVEIYNGTSWTGVAGIQSGITVAQATDISAQWALTLG